MAEALSSEGNMATDSYSHLEKQDYTLAVDYDFTVRVIEYGNVIRTEGDGDAAYNVTVVGPKKVHEFKGKRDILIANSTHMQALLSDNGGANEKRSTTDLDEHSVLGITVWLKLVHGSEVKSTYTTMSLRDMWEILATADKYKFNTKIAEAKTWFEGWYTANQTDKAGKKFDFKDFQMLLLPCYTFDYAAGFAFATRYLVYRATGNITERKPEGFENLRLGDSIMLQLNAAKGRLKTMLHRGLYNPIDHLLKRALCRCKYNVLYAYEHYLTCTGAWPLEHAFLKENVNDVLRKYDNFASARVLVPQTCGSMCCSFDFTAEVVAAKNETRKYFDGLCLGKSYDFTPTTMRMPLHDITNNFYLIDFYPIDCMAASNTRLGNPDDEAYWTRGKATVQWDHECRIRHAQPSWYYSFLGRRHKMIDWTKETRTNGSSKGGRNGGFEEVVDGVQGLAV